MPSRPEISVIVSAFDRPAHLRRCLLSLAAQHGVAGQVEVIVADDGSRDITADVVAKVGREVGFRIEVVTHPHHGFQQARSRNEGALAATAPYLLFIDADCIVPPDHLQQQLAARRPGVARAGDCMRLDEATSAAIDDVAARSGSYLASIAPAARRWRRRVYAKSLFYQLMHYRQRPKLIGWNMAMWKSDLARINGFDQRFRGWGCEDDDLAARLRKSGVRVCTSLGYTHGYHLWHALDSTTPRRWRDGGNVPYLMRPVRLTRCLDGLAPRRLEDVSLRCIAGSEHADLAIAVDRRFTSGPSPLEIELLFWPSPVGFSRLADHRILVAADPQAAPASVRRQADAEISLGADADADSVLAQLEHLLHGRAVSSPTAGAGALAATAVAA